MDKTRLISIAIILGVICLLGGLALKWHNDTTEAKLREQAAQNEGAIIVLKTQLIKSHIQTAHMKHIADSAIAASNKVDTVFIKPKYDKSFSNIRHLGANALVGDLAKRLPH